MKKIKTILAGVDFSACSESALAQALRLAKANQAELHVFHVIDPLVVEELGWVLKAPESQVLTQVQTDALKDMEKMLSRLDKAPNVQKEVAVGSVIEETFRKINQTHADLLVLGIRGAGNPGNGAGTVAIKCVRKAPTMVMLVRPDHQTPFQKVVACVDFSEISPYVVQQAVSLARAEGSEFHLLHVCSPPWKWVHYGAPTPEASVEFQREYRHALKARLESYVENLPDEQRKQLPIQCDIVEYMNFAYGIIDFVNTNHVDMLVLANEGRLTWRSFFLGSTAERVLYNAPCSILAVKPPQAEPESVGK